MKLKSLSIAAIAAFAITSCGEINPKAENNAVETPNAEKVPESFTVEATAPGPEFPGATLTVKNLKATPIEGTDSVSVTIDYGVSNYELKMQTSDAANRSCNNSKEGQHIHFILDNMPYAALYEPTHTFSVQKGGEHLLLSFLSRSYHLSLKNKEAHTLLKFKVDEKGNIVKLDTPKEPMVFYSRPKGTYLGDDAKEILLDFFVVNADLGPDQYKVQANINGKSSDITKWEPYLIKGLSMGQNKIQLTLMKADGTGIDDNGFTSVSREFVMSEGEPITK